MIIEFADPGYNWLPIWIAAGIVLLAIGIMIALYPVLGDAVASISIIPILAIVFSPVLGAMLYGNAVTESTTASLKEIGFSSVGVVNDRFTASTEDGKYFSGVLVDLHPESGYAYQVLELTGTEK